MTAALLEISNVAKSFPGVRALDNVSFTLRHGEVLTLAGENGAAKSTLLGILLGFVVGQRHVQRGRRPAGRVLAPPGAGRRRDDRPPGAGHRSPAHRRAEPPAGQDGGAAARGGGSDRRRARRRRRDGLPAQPADTAAPVQPGPAARDDDHQGVRVRREDRRTRRADKLDARTQRGGRARPGAPARGRARHRGHLHLAQDARGHGGVRPERHAQRRQRRIRAA